MKAYTLPVVLSFMCVFTVSAAEQQLTIDLLVNESFVVETFLRVRGYDAGDTEGGVAKDELCPMYTFDRDTSQAPTYIGTDFPYVKVTGDLTFNQVGYGADQYPVDVILFSKSADDHLLLDGKPLYRYKDCPADAFSIPLHQIEMSGSSTWDRGYFYALKYDGSSYKKVYAPVVARAVPNEATERLLSDRQNDPGFGSEQNQGFAATNTLSDADVKRYQAIMENIGSVFGDYRNWHTVVLDSEGTDQENARVFELLTEIGYKNWDEDIRVNGWTTEKARQYSSCLTGSEPNGLALEAKSNFVTHSLCIMWKKQYTVTDEYFYHQMLQLPVLPEGEFYHRWANDYGLLDLLYHEYFHHYQRAHTLDRAMGLDNAEFDFPERNVNVPWWWIEGAGQFAAWYARDHWREMGHFAYLDPDNPAYDGYWDELDWDIPAPNSGNNYSSLDDHIEFSLNQLNASFFFGASQVQDTSNKKNGVLNAAIPDDQSCEGWEASPEDGWYSGDYRRSYEGQGNCTFIIFAAGTQFIAHKSSWQVALRDIPADYYELGFWGSIEKHLDLTELEFYAEFNALLRSVDANTIDETYAPPGWKIPEESMMEIVRFNDIGFYTGEPDTQEPPALKVSLEEPVEGEIHTGVGNLRGWAVGEAGIEKVELWIDDVYAFDVPYGGPRGDVGAAFPDVAGSGESGFSMAYAYSGLTAGEHTAKAIAYDADGSVTESAISFSVVKFEKSFIADPNAVDLNNASCSVSGDEVSVVDAVVNGDPLDMLLKWRTAEQGFEIIEIHGSGATVAMLQQRQSTLSGDAVANTDGSDSALKVTLEEPVNAEIHGGVGNLRGWAVASQGIEKIEIYIDGDYAFDAPYGGAREDVGAAFPDVANSTESGFSLAFAYSNLSSGAHTMEAVARTADGQEARSAATFEVVKFAQGFISDPQAVNLDAAECVTAGDEISISGAVVAGETYDMVLDWRTAEQGFEIVEIR